MTLHHDQWTTLKTALTKAPERSTVAVSVRDITTGATFGQHEEMVLPSASTIKIVILVALARAVDEGRLDLHAITPILETQRVGGSGVLTGLRTPGLALTLADHAWLMITISDNTASNVLIDAVGVDAIHATQQRLELGGTSLNRRFIGRLPEAGTPENLATANDLVAVLKAIATGTAASQERCDWMLDVLKDQQYTDRLGRHLPATVTFAGKSGSLEGYCHDTAILTGPKGAAIVAVLTEGFADKFEAVELIGAIGAAVVTDLQLA